MTDAQRLKGQEVSIRVIQAGNVVNELSIISAFNDNVALEIKEAGYLGETVNRFDEILNGYGGDFESHLNRAEWNNFVQAVIDRAERRTPDVQFNVVRVDFFPNGDSSVYTYTDVFWGGIPTSVPTRGDYVKVRGEFRCSERPVQTNQLP